MSTPACKMNMTQAINLALDDALAADPRVLVFGEDVADPEGGGVVGVTKGLSTKYGTRVRSTPISEQAIIGAAIGAAIAGMRPVAEIMLMNFTTVCMDMIVNHAAKLRFMSGGQTGVPLVIRTMTGAGFSNGGQHSDFLEAWFAHTAGLKVVVPSSPAEAYGLMLSCIDDEDPCIFVENLPILKGTPGLVTERGKRIPLGKANILRSGTDVTVIGYSRQVHDAVAVGEKLSKGGVSVEVIDLRTVSPLDMDTIIASVSKTKRAVVVHEAARSFGVGAEIASRITEALFGTLKAPVERIGSAFCAVPFSKPLETAFVPGQEQIEAGIRRAMAAGGR